MSNKTMKKINYKHIDSITHLVLHGVTYGYPECCINEFVAYFLTDSYSLRENRKLLGTGYIPCKQCNNKSEKELVKSINRKRYFITPFDSYVKPEHLKILKKRK